MLTFAAEVFELDKYEVMQLLEIFTEHIRLKHKVHDC